MAKKIQQLPGTKKEKRRPREVSGLVANKWVRIMCDYSADGVWARNGGGAMLEDLPVSADLRARIRAWQDWYEKYSYPDFSNAPLGFDIDAFSIEGLAIANAVKAELPDWTVVYHDEAKAAPRYRPPYTDVPRAHYQYEV
jgi:hypothetical protein